MSEILVRQSEERVKNAETEEKKQEELERYNTARSVHEEGLRVLRYIAFLITILIGLGATNSVNVVDLLQSGTVVGLALVFALQPWLRNMIGGVFIFADLKFKINDKIKVINQTGVVEDVTLRFTRLRRPDNVHVFIPNSRVLEQAVCNYSRRSTRIIQIKLQVSRTTSVKQLRSAIKSLELQIPNLHPDLMSHYDAKLSSRGPADAELKPDSISSSFFAGLSDWMEIAVLVKVGGDSLHEEEFSKLKTELLLRIREVLEDLKIEIVGEKILSRNVLLHPENVYRLDYLINEDDIEQSIMATALFQM